MQVKIKYRVESRGDGCSYLLFGTYDNLKTAKNKKNKLVLNGLYGQKFNNEEIIIKQVTTITQEKIIL